MLFKGEWLEANGTIRPTLLLRVLASDGTEVSERFLLDCGADRTIFSAALLRDLHWPAAALHPATSKLSGIGGDSAFVLLNTSIVLPRTDGPRFPLRANFAAFTDPKVLDMSLLGRDILDPFDVIVSRPRNEVLLLCPLHSYAVTIA